VGGGPSSEVCVTFIYFFKGILFILSVSVVLVVVEGFVFLVLCLKKGGIVSNMRPLIFCLSVVVPILLSSVQVSLNISLTFFFSVYDVKQNSYSVSKSMKQLPHPVSKKQHGIFMKRILASVLHHFEMDYVIRFGKKLEKFGM